MTALKEFSKKKKLKIKVEYVKDRIEYARIGNLNIEKTEDSINAEI